MEERKVKKKTQPYPHLKNYIVQLFVEYYVLKTYLLKPFYMCMRIYELDKYLYCE
jgi:hypothetical protein